MAILALINEATEGGQPPVDIEADVIIRACFKRHPEAAYRVTMLAMRLAAQTGSAPAPKSVAVPRGRWFSGLFERFAHPF